MVIKMKKPFEIIRDLREDKDLKQKDVADFLKMSRTTYNHYELGHTSLNEEMIIKLSDFYGVTPNFILNYNEKNTINDVSILKLNKMIIEENIDIDSLITLLKNCKKLYK